MSESLIAGALFERLRNLTLSPPLQVAWPNVVFPAAGSDKPDTYLKAALMRRGTEGVGISAWNDHGGILQVDVVYKAQDGEVKPLAIADSVADWFARGTRLANGAIQVDVYEPPQIASPVRESDDYLKIPVSVRYRSFVQ